MNVELTIQEMFDEYPTLFKERADCLNHLFCCIGNGYEWINGELVEAFDDHTNRDINQLQSRLINGKAHQHNKMSLRAESQYYENERIADGWYEDFAKKYPDIFRLQMELRLSHEMASILPMVQFPISRRNADTLLQISADSKN